MLQYKFCLLSSMKELYQCIISWRSWSILNCWSVEGLSWSSSTLWYLQRSFCFQSSLANHDRFRLNLLKIFLHSNMTLLLVSGLSKLVFVQLRFWVTITQVWNILSNAVLLYIIWEITHHRQQQFNLKKKTNLKKRNKEITKKKIKVQ